MRISDILHPKNIGTPMNFRIVTDNLNRRLNNIYKDIKVGFIFSDNRILLKAKIPSERNDELLEKIYYDVAILFTPNKETEHKNTINEYDIKVFSNCPSFTFGYTYTYNKAKSLIFDRILDKNYYSKLALKKPAKEKNPHNITGIEKSLWFTVRFIQITGINYLNRMNSYEINGVTFENFNQSVITQDEMVELIQNVERKTKRIRKAKNKVKEKRITKSLKSSPEGKHIMSKSVSSTKLKSKLSIKTKALQRKPIKKAKVLKTYNKKQLIIN